MTEHPVKRGRCAQRCFQGRPAPFAKSRRGGCLLRVTRVAGATDPRVVSVKHTVSQSGAALATGILALYCASASFAAAEEKLMSLTIRSSAFVPGGSIPSLYTCEGKDLSPPLAFGGVPAGAQSLALIVDDPDAPDPAAPKMTWVHWVLYNIPAASVGLPEAIKSTALPAGTREGRNDWGRTGYGGPCPPVGRHRYFHKLYALDVVLPPLAHADKPALEKAMRGHILESAELIGTYQKGR